MRCAPDLRFPLSSFRTLRNRKSSQFTPTTTGAAPAATSGIPALRGRSRLARVVARRASQALLATALVGAVLVPLAQTPASASTPPRRLVALWWAEHQAGKWYCWGGMGPTCFDCSGLVMEAYRHAGIWLPRTTYQMLASPKLRRIPASDRRRGDLAFYGTGHVELVTFGGTFGALDWGTRIGWHDPSIWWHPTMYFRVR